MKEVAEMLKDVCKVRAQSLGNDHTSVAEAACAVSLLFIALKDQLQAKQALQEAEQALTQQSCGSKLALMLSTAQTGLQTGFAVTAL